MAVEIERKFLLNSDLWRQQVAQSTRFRQGYLIGAKHASVRVRIEGDKANINIKSATLGVTRQEYEYPVPLVDAEELLDSLCDKPLIEKTRHLVVVGEHHWEIDEFHGDNQGLVVAEIELHHEDEDFTKPQWLGKDVSDDKRYYNVLLAQHPYSTWGGNSS